MKDKRESIMLFFCASLPLALFFASFIALICIFMVLALSASARKGMEAFVAILPLTYLIFYAVLAVWAVAGHFIAERYYRKHR